MTSLTSLTIDRSYSSPLEALAEASRLYGHGDVTVSRPASGNAAPRADREGRTDPQPTPKGETSP